jgi:hypothetical protein
VQYTLFFSKYFIQHCFICLPSDFTVSEDAGIEPRTVGCNILHWQSDAVTTRLKISSIVVHTPDKVYCTYICTVDHIVVSLVNLIFNFAHEGGGRGGQLLAEIHHHQMQIGNRDGGIRMGG